MNKLAITVACVVMACTSAQAYELGSSQSVQKPGITLGGGTAASPPPGIYMIDQVWTFRGVVAGPGNALLNPSGATNTGAQTAFGGAAFLFAPGWEFLGAKYTAVVIPAFVMKSVGSPLNVQASGMGNLYVVPGELSWKLGDSGFFVKTGFGMYLPTGTITGVAGTGNVGRPWYTFVPQLAVSYLKDGWNFTTYLYQEMNTENSITKYRGGNVLHADFTATKSIGKWRFGPVGYYVGQVTNDRSSPYYGNAVNVNKYDIWAAGGLIGYDFGTAALNVWALQEVSANASGGRLVGGIDSATIPRGFSVLGSLSYRLWAPEEPAPTKLPFTRK